MRKFLAPDPARLIIFAVLLLIALMGSLQSDGFTDRSLLSIHCRRKITPDGDGG